MHSASTFVLAVLIADLIISPGVGFTHDRRPLPLPINSVRSDTATASKGIAALGRKPKNEQSGRMAKYHQDAESAPFSTAVLRGTRKMTATPGAEVNQIDDALQGRPFSCAG
jgi:hypothetical protein